jgi:hypothetical protein
VLISWENISVQIPATPNTFLSEGGSGKEGGKKNAVVISK